MQLKFQNESFEKLKEGIRKGLSGVEVTVETKNGECFVVVQIESGIFNFKLKFSSGCMNEVVISLLNNGKYEEVEEIPFPQVNEVYDFIVKEVIKKQVA